MRVRVIPRLVRASSELISTHFRLRDFLLCGHHCTSSSLTLSSNREEDRCRLCVSSPPPLPLFQALGAAGSPRRGLPLGVYLEEQRGRVCDGQVPLWMKLIWGQGLWEVNGTWRSGHPLEGRLGPHVGDLHKSGLQTVCPGVECKECGRVVCTLPGCSLMGVFVEERKLGGMCGPY